MCWCSKAWPTLSFTVEKPKTYSQTSSVPLCRLTSRPSWIHREQAYVSETPPQRRLVSFWNDMKLIADSKVILAIRRAEHLRRLVYVACNAKAAMNNFIEWVPFRLLQMLFNRLGLLKCINSSPAYAEHHPTESTALLSVRCEPWPWICFLRPCTWRCCFSWREWTTTPRSSSPAAPRKRP